MRTTSAIQRQKTNQKQSLGSPGLRPVAPSEGRPLKNGWVLLGDKSIEKHFTLNAKVRIWKWKEHFIWERSRVCKDTGSYIQVANGFTKTIEKAKEECFHSKGLRLKSQLQRLFR